jgi:hypothetical protein
LVQDNKIVEVKDMLLRLIPSYQSNSKIVDLYYQEQLKNKDNLKTYPKVKGHKDKEVTIKAK